MMDEAEEITTRGQVTEPSINRGDSSATSAPTGMLGVVANISKLTINIIDFRHRRWALVTLEHSQSKRTRKLRNCHNTKYLQHHQAF